MTRTIDWGDRMRIKNSSREGVAAANINVLPRL